MDKIEDEKIYTVQIENLCDCFKQNTFENKLTFETKSDATMKAKIIECLMSQELACKHYFEAEDKGDTIIIHTLLSPEDDEEDDNYA